jgi:hypothetical protein
MKVNFGLKELPNGGYSIVHLESGDVLPSLEVGFHSDNKRLDWKYIQANFSGIPIIGKDYIPPEKKDCGVELQVDIDTAPLRESLRSLGEDLIKLADKS